MKKTIRTLYIILSIIIMPSYSAFANVCFYKSEETNSFYKICYYECMGMKTAATIKAPFLCPHTLQSSKILIN